MPPAKASPLAQIRELENDPKVKALVAEHLPPNYDFEIPKTIWRIRKNPNCRTVALQFPEGLLIFSTKIGRILTELTGVDVVLMGDITYGACCIDDHTASMLGADLLVHYGHSCLVPVAVANRIETIYVFVTIRFSVDLAAESICSAARDVIRQRRHRGQIRYEGETPAPLKLWLISTIQFANSLGELRKLVEQSLGGDNVVVDVPRCKPLSNGEVLGCTAPKVDGDVIFYVGDGRFHLEAMMMANPGVLAYRYDPYNRTLTLEEFDHGALSLSRSSCLSRVVGSMSDGGSSKPRVGVILGTLGRQGNPRPMQHVYELLQRHYSPFILLMSEVMPAKLKLFRETVAAFVQFACPRLSIDWGDAFHVPVLTSYEATLLANNNNKGQPAPYSHPMDYYAFQSTGPHTPNHECK